MSKICLHGYVSGRVQGVFYRRHTAEQAKSRGVTGWARNLSDGRVEVFICGEQQDVEALRDWLWEGPAASEVTGVDLRETAFQQMIGFEVK